MAALVAPPVVQYATSAAWIAAPAAGQGDLAWLEVERRDGSPRTIAAFRGDRLVLRAAGQTRTVVHEDCDPGHCDIVRAPVAGAEGAFAYSVAFPGAIAYVASVSAAGASTVVSEDAADPTAVKAPQPIATTAAAVVWEQGGSIRIAPASGGTGAVLVPAESTGGTVTALSAGPAGIAWSVTRPDGGTAIVVRAITGQLAVRAEEPKGPTSLAQPALMDDGTVVAVRRVPAGGRIRVDVVAIAPDGTRRTLVSSTPLSRREAAETVRPAVSGTLVAARVRSGARGANDALWLVDAASTRRQRVQLVDRTSTRLSDPSLGGGRLAWARTEVRGTSLVRARLVTAKLRG